MYLKPQLTRPKPGLLEAEAKRQKISRSRPTNFVLKLFVRTRAVIHFRTTSLIWYVICGDFTCCQKLTESSSI